VEPRCGGAGSKTGDLSCGKLINVIVIRFSGSVGRPTQRERSRTGFSWGPDRNRSIDSGGIEVEQARPSGRGAGRRPRGGSLWRPTQGKIALLLKRIAPPGGDFSPGPTFLHPDSASGRRRSKRVGTEFLDPESFAASGHWPLGRSAAGPPRGLK